MPRYHVTLTDTEIQELKSLIQKGGKGYRIKHAQILLKLDQKPENSSWTYDRIKEAYGASHSTIAGIAQRFVTEGMESESEKKSAQQANQYSFLFGPIKPEMNSIYFILYDFKNPDGVQDRKNESVL